MNRDIALSMIALSLVSFSFFARVSPVEARKNWTITQRQVQLRKEVESGQKANELTLKEANTFRDKLSDLTGDEAKMRAKNGGKLSYKDEGKLEKRLNSISVDLHKQKLAKRTIAK